MGKVVRTGNYSSRNDTRQSPNTMTENPPYLSATKQASQGSENLPEAHPKPNCRNKASLITKGAPQEALKGISSALLLVGLILGTSPRNVPRLFKQHRVLPTRIHAGQQKKATLRFFCEAGWDGDSALAT